MEITFTNAIYLWGLTIIPVLIVLYFASIRYSRAMALKFANFVALSRVSGGVGEVSNISILVVRMMALICVILSISGMTIWYVGVSTNKDYIVAIDSSASMSATDFIPNRLEAAKDAAADFIDKLPINSYVGVLSFSGVSFVEHPLTQEKNLAKESISNIHSKNIGGTDLGNAIITATNLLTSSKKARSIILLTDGRSNIGIAEETAIDYAITHKTTVNTIGIGSSNESENLTLGIDEETLIKMANLTLGSYYYAENNDKLKNVYNEIINSQKRSKNPFDLSFILLIAALILLLSDWLLGTTIYRRIP